MIVQVKEIGTNTTPFSMKKESAERLVSNNPKKYQILDNHFEVAPLKKKIEPISEPVVIKSKKSRKNNNFEKDLRED
jgi:hypothetical protein